MRHLRREQLFYRIKYKLRRWAKPQASRRPITQAKCPSSTLENLSTYQRSLKCPFDAPTLEQGRFDFINIQEQTTYPPEWDFASKYKLWRYQLHYFDWIWALDFDQARTCVTSWIEQYPYKRGRDGWEAYPTSLRLINWSLYFLACHRESWNRNHMFKAQFLESIQLQANWLERNIEYHLMANHLFENAGALTLIGALFEGEDAARWGQKGRSLLEQEVKEQILPDGGHFERSPMYHLRLLHVLKYATLASPSASRTVFDRALQTMTSAFHCMCHPDGQIALLNDSNFGVYPLLPTNPADKKPEPNGQSWALKDTGYYGYRGREGDYILVDAGAIGPDYNPGHAHGDILSYEMSLGGRRMIVDAGNFDYEPGSMRDYCRSTRAHNTVEIDQTDQSQFWATFRVAQRAHPKDVDFKSTPGGFELQAWHDGYLRLDGRAKHTRRFLYSTRKGLLVEDRIEALQPVRAISRIHFHPECRIQQESEQCLRVSREDTTCRIQWDDRSEGHLAESLYCPEFNQSIPNQCLCLQQHDRSIEMAYQIQHFSQ